jgi:hypothetical protein
MVLRAGDAKDDVKFRLSPLGSIAGRVMDADGEAVERATVTIETGPGNAIGKTTTDDRGRFELVDLRPGKYRVRAVLSREIVTLPEIRTDGTVDIRYAPTYYGGVIDYKSAARVEVGTGADVSGIEIRLVKVPVMRVSGRVLGAPAEQRGGEMLFAQTNNFLRFASVKRDGSFEVWNVDPGRYFLTATFSADNQRVQTSPVNVEIGQSNLENLELHVIPAADVTGQVVFDDDGARPKGGAKIELRTVDPGMMTIQPTVSDLAEDGTFRLMGVRAARYRVMLSWTGVFVRSVTVGTKQTDGNVAHLRDGAGGAPLTVVVSSAVGSVAGVVSDGNAPVAGARVALLREDFVSRGDCTLATTDASGTYSITNVRPGRYRIAVVDDDSAPLLGNLDDYEDVMQRVEVAPKEKMTRDLKRHTPVK